MFCSLSLMIDTGEEAAELKVWVPLYIPSSLSPVESRYDDTSLQASSTC